MTNNIKHGVVSENLDATVSPKEDFYQYSCGGWMKSNPLRPEFSRFGTFDKLRDNSRYQLRELIQHLSDNPDSKVKGTIAQKISDLYSMALDTERRGREGFAPMLWMIDKVNSLNVDNFTEILAFVQHGISSALFSVGVGPDPKDSGMNILHIGETGLCLGDRDYYLEKNENNDRIMDAYHKFLLRVMALSGFNEENAERIWNSVIEIETQLAKHKKTREERRDPSLSCNFVTMDELRHKFFNIEWDRYFGFIGIEPPEKINISSMKFLEFINTYIPTISMSQMRDLLLFNIVTSSTGVLSEDFQEAEFELFGRVMSGQEEMKPLWKRAMSIPTSMFSEAVGQLYVEKYFPEENKTYMKNLVENLRKSLGKHISQLDWMSEDTKARAFDKLASMKVKIGYPDKWKDYSEIEIDPEKSYLENVYKASLWFVNDNYSKLGKPVDKDEWFMSPHTVNAYYSPMMNEICFPAGILQPPYFDVSADDALNYGGIGVVIGHEMTHGFDDMGRQFDKDGNLANWWHEVDEKKFNALADTLVEQFNEVEVAPGVYANGRFTLGENIADQGGLRVALTAYLDSRNDGEMEDIDGFSPLQRFYISYGNVWASNIRDEEILECTKTDPHSLSRNRVNVTLKNIDEFFEAFGIKDGDRMYRKPEERVVIW